MKKTYISPLAQPIALHSEGRLANIIVNSTPGNTVDSKDDAWTQERHPGSFEDAGFHHNLWQD